LITRVAAVAFPAGAAPVVELEALVPDVPHPAKMVKLSARINSPHLK